MYTDDRNETMHRIVRNLSQIAQKFTGLTKIEIENARKKFAQFMLFSKDDRKFGSKDRV